MNDRHDEYDALAYLDSKESMYGYLLETFEEDDVSPDEILDSVADVVMAQAYLQIAKDTGIDYETICDAFFRRYEPDPVIISKIAKAVITTLNVKPESVSEEMVVRQGDGQIQLAAATG